MPPFRGPERGPSHYLSPLIRLGEEYYVAELEDGAIDPEILAEKETLLPEILARKRTDQDGVDAAFLLVNNGDAPIDRTIFVFGDSNRLGLPLTREAREKTCIGIQRLSKGYKLKILQHPR